MKTLILIRHAKSDWSQNLKDHDRPLNPRGLRNAPEMAQRLLARGVTVDCIVSSSANRAHATAKLIAEMLNYPTELIRIEPSLYACSPNDWKNAIKQLPDDKHCAVIVGHNPEISSVVSQLSGQYHSMPTCAVAQMHFQMDNWQSVASSTADSTIMDSPKVPYQA